MKLFMLAVGFSKKEDLFEEYKTDDFFQKYMHNHFSSIEEIKEKYPELN